MCSYIDQFDTCTASHREAVASATFYFFSCQMERPLAPHWKSLCCSPYLVALNLPVEVDGGRESKRPGFGRSSVVAACSPGPCTCHRPQHCSPIGLPH
ncbi:hypothetical protein BU14_0255s0008 [Porphyra umbilicalis]|uniref:Uncharacterized protein n=1 Tax=Porphyra umbilicalis TaxID=2786 RepID=A0A1X6P2K7_PORUM|nr:hypothetical protein BU14_0255s0008 [Porphyra umbilicalis]|eukprot:OSX75101.1 hypothetical protein BU14_0255s0008 [Porphyra umbilicalis]